MGGASHARADEHRSQVSVQLADVLAFLDWDFLRVLGGPTARPKRISDIVIFDSADTQAVGADAIVLAVAVSAGGADAAALLELAGERGAAAVVFRTDEPLPPRIEELAARVEVTVLGVPPDMRWGQVYSLLQTATASTGDFELPLETGVPIGDLFALADAIAVAVGAPVTIEDPQWRLLAYSNLDYEIDDVRRDHILGRQPPPVWRKRIEERGLAAALRSSDGLVRFVGEKGDGLAPRVIAPVRAGDELLGSLWVAETGAPLEPAAERELERAAKLATVHFLSHRASEDIKRRTRGTVVRQVLEGWTPSGSMVRSPGPHTVLVFAPETRTSRSQVPEAERVLGIVSLHCESRHQDALCALVEERVWSIVPALGSDERASMLDLAARVLERVEASLGLRLVAAIGTTVPKIADVPRSKRAAEEALDVLERRPSARLVHIDDVRAHAALHHVVDWASGNPELAESEAKLEKLRAHDREREADYEATLRAYLDARGDIRVAAKRLSVHPNTLRHRLHRLTEISGLELDDPDERLMTELQLRIRQARQAG